jgi:transposase
MITFLTFDERSSLLTQHKCERDGRVKDRIKALLLADEGMMYVDIARVLFIDDQSVSRFVKEYKDTQKTKPQNGGSFAKLNDEQARELCEHLEENLYTKAKDIAAYVLKKYNVSYTESGMTYWLNAHNFSYKKPKGIPAKADLAKQAAFIEAYEQLMNTTPDNEPILFCDAVHPTMATKLSCGWIRCGQDHEIPTTGNRTRINLLGALNLELMQTITRDYETINGDSAVDFFDYLINEKYTDAPKIHLIIDNAGYFTGQIAEEWLKNNPRLQVHFLPPYSPNLNPIERLWKVFHEHVSNNQYYASGKEFKAAVLNFFNKTFPDHIHSLIELMITFRYSITYLQVERV